ncbi:hypothetical protein GCM10027169_33030 [Gordonia jinhuaensis]|uniref:Uncharacterized protein n=1 Tax=Gordonia jinhuaensis TaxID=1517702 RepID=A0A916WSS9_9ACTN|nr:hypothetical protein [Gordonia jinhuaensis]GGB27244.1 hypothetical protein GCM10011489_14230 [Gordonia jinhuaensis]
MTHATSSVSALFQRMIDITRPIFEAQKTPVASDLTTEQVATNKFLDPSIGLS